jgi:hypothetical protein
MRQKLKQSKPIYSPETGLMLSGTVKEQLQNMLDAGYFDDVDTMILATATPNSYSTYHIGRVWDCFALYWYLYVYLQEASHG